MWGRRTTISADRGSHAAGRDIIGILPRDLKAIIAEATGSLERLNKQQLERIEKLQQQLGVTGGQIMAFFRIIGEASIRPEDMLRRLVEVAARYKELHAQAMSSGPTDDPGVKRLKAEARLALETEVPDLGRADELFAQVEAAQLATSDRLALDAAVTRAQRAEIAMTRLRYREAADHFAAAAALLLPTHQAQRLDYMDMQAEALFRHGDEFGDNETLAEAVSTLEEILRLRALGETSLDWAMTQNNLGRALLVLGRRERGTARLDDAVAAFRAALKGYRRDRMPEEWAMTQNNLGNALRTLGLRERGTARLKEAVAAFRAALEEFTRDRVPLDWARTQNHLGNALLTLGGRERGTARLEEALAAHRAALKELTRDRVPLEWAMTQNNLGSALRALGLRERRTAHLEEAVAAFHAALKEYTRDRVPLYWAMTQSNLGDALVKLGEQESGTASLEKAVTACRAALEERTRDRVPLEWAMTQNHLGNALRVLGERESGTMRLEEAVAAHRAALKEYRSDREPLQWAMSTGNHGVACMLLAERLGDAIKAQTAVKQIEVAFVAMRDGENTPFAEYYGAQLIKAQGLTDRLAGR